MKKKKTVSYPPPKSSAHELKDAAMTEFEAKEPMIRTQIYLNQREYDFVQSESKRRNEPMAAVIREFIDDKMEIPDDAWTNNPMLEPTVIDPKWKSHEDGAVNHDHYIYGCPKKWIKVKGKTVEAPPLPGDYYENRASAAAYDKMLRDLDEFK